MSKESKLSVPSILEPSLIRRPQMTIFIILINWQVQLNLEFDAWQVPLNSGRSSYYFCNLWQFSPKTQLAGSPKLENLPILSPVQPASVTFGRLSGISVQTRQEEIECTKAQS